MYYFDNRKHKLAHIHVKYQGEQAIFTIPEYTLVSESPLFWCVETKI